MAAAGDQLMWNRFLKWNRRRLFLKAYRILRNESERHRGAGHDVTFEAVNEAHVVLKCHSCPQLQPMARKRIF